MRNDAADNLLGALLVAGHFIIPEVTVYFNDKLYRGNRVSKVSSTKLEAFYTPNLIPLGSFNVSFKLQWDKILHVPDKTKALTVFNQLETSISYLVISPFLDIKLI